MVTVFEVTPPIATTMGTAAPVTAAPGTWAFTWHGPAYPGANPEKDTVAGTPPTVTDGAAKVADSGFEGEADPRLFDPDEAERVCLFLECLPHIKGDLSRGPRLQAVKPRYPA